MGEAEPEVTPKPTAVIDAEEWGAFKEAVAWIREALEKNHICTSQAEIRVNTDWRKATAAWSITMTFFLLGLVVTVFTQCQQHAEADGRMQARVDAHAAELNALKQGLKDTNEARRADTESILREIRALKTVEESPPHWCKALESRDKKRLRKLFGARGPCEGVP